METNSPRLFLSVITVAEIETGIAKLRRQRATAKADRIATWRDTLVHLYAARILPIDLDVARHLGILTDQTQAAGIAPGLADLAIAATAASRSLTVLTRNVRHFRALSVSCHDPFAALPPDSGGGEPLSPR